MTAAPVPEGETARLERFDELCRQADPGDWTALPISTHAHLLLLDLRAAFGGGAWLSVVVLAQSIVEASLREIGGRGFSKTARQLFEADPRLMELWALRNDITHPTKARKASVLWAGTGDMAARHAFHYASAARAVVLMSEAMYAHREVYDVGDDEGSLSE